MEDLKDSILAILLIAMLTNLPNGWHLESENLSIIRKQPCDIANCRMRVVGYLSTLTARKDGGMACPGVDMFDCGYYQCISRGLRMNEDLKSTNRICRLVANPYL